MKALWSDLTRRLGIAEPPAEEDGNVALAAAALLLEMSEADMEVTAEERTAVRDALCATFGLTREEIEATLVAAAEGIDREVSYFPHVETINAVCDPADKERIVEHMWRVAFADGALDRYEEHYLRRLCELLHVPHRVFIQTRHRVEAAVGGGGS